VFNKAIPKDGPFVADGMSVSELSILIARATCRSALEIGMANGTSSVVICAALATQDGQLTSVDPFQSTEYRNLGRTHIARAGFQDRHRLIDEPNYLALPRLVQERQQFDVVFIDGRHSFDHVMLDTFYSDLLLRDTGLLILHDTDSPAVNKALRFVETHSPYHRLSPRPVVALDSIGARIARRSRALFSRSGAHERAERLRWRTLSAYRKMSTTQAPESLVANF
jgi:predicted O-methyltransferase YrrM